MKRVLRSGPLLVELGGRPRAGDGAIRFVGEIAAAAFVRRLAEDDANLTALRALLAEELHRLDAHRMSRAEVIDVFAAQLAAGRIAAVRRATPPLQGWEAAEPGEEAPPAAAPVRRGEKTWIGIELVDMEGNPLPGERYWIELTDGSIREGRLDAKGRAYFGDLDPGDCEIRFPDLDDEATVPPPASAIDRRAAPAGERRAAGKTWIEIELVDMDGRPIPDEPYRIALTDGTTREGRLDAQGRARHAGIDPGIREVTFPGIDDEALIRPGGSAP